MSATFRCRDHRRSGLLRFVAPNPLFNRPERFYPSAQTCERVGHNRPRCSPKHRAIRKKWLEAGEFRPNPVHHANRGAKAKGLKLLDYCSIRR